MVEFLSVAAPIGAKSCGPRAIPLEITILSAFEPRSLIIVASLLGMLSAVILLVMHRSFPPSIRGIGWWGWGACAGVACTVLVAARELIPDFISIVIGSSLLTGTIMSMYIGLMQFAKRRANFKLLAAVAAIELAWMSWFTLIDPNYQLRVLVLSGINMVLLMMCTRVVFQASGKTPAGLFTGIAFLMVACISTARFIGMATGLDPSTSALSANPLQKFYIASFSFFLLTVTVGLMMLANERLRMELEYIASRDGLSGLYARATFIDLLQKELARSERNQRPLTLLLFDLDNFKSINDRYGHLTGDKVIVHFAQTISQLLRQHDLIGRFGGEEFIALLPETARDDALAIAERICSTVAASSTAGIPGYTVSIGVATTDGGKTEVDDLFNRADQALYLAKKNGRNRVEPARHASENVGESIGSNVPGSAA